MNTVILFVWTVVAASPHSIQRDWRPIGEFTTLVSCERAVATLGLDTTKARCVLK